MIVSRIKEFMEAKGFTYKQLEEATGLTAQTISRMRGEKTAEARLKTLEIIAHALGSQVKDLFDEEGPPGE